MAGEAKRCILCDKTKPVGEFHNTQSTTDKLSSYCKECSRAKSKAWQRANRERAAANKKNWEQENARRARENNMRTRGRHPEKARARKAVHRAVKRGTLHKPSRCERCDKPTERRLLHAHHEDYSRPLDVDWLCHPCHVEAHGGTPITAEESSDAKG